MYDHTELFCLIDYFCIRIKPIYLKNLKDSGLIKRARSAVLDPLEILFLAVWFLLSHFKTFKHLIAFYHRHAFTAIIPLSTHHFAGDTVYAYPSMALNL